MQTTQSFIKSGLCIGHSFDRDTEFKANALARMCDLGKLGARLVDSGLNFK